MFNLVDDIKKTRQEYYNLKQTNDKKKDDFDNRYKQKKPRNSAHAKIVRDRMKSMVRNK